MNAESNSNKIENLMPRIDYVLDGLSLRLFTEILLYALAISLIIRCFSAVMKAIISQRNYIQDPDSVDSGSGASRTETKNSRCSVPSSYWNWFLHHFWGAEDLWFPYFIGVSELVIFPLMMKAEAIVVVGGWIGIKALGGWDGWKASRPLYSAFLVGTILTIFGGYFIYRAIL